jgi:hypothetical protein
MIEGKSNYGRNPMKDFFECTCGYQTESEVNAIRHASQWHASDEERSDLERLKIRIRIMISSPFREFSFDEAQ